MFSFCVRSLTWLSPSSLKSAEAKLANMVDLIGYPKLVLNTTWLDSVYSDVEVSDDDYLVNCKICSIRQTLPYVTKEVVILFHEHLHNI